MSETRSVFKAGVSAAIYTNTQRLIKGNTVRDQFLVMADSVLFFDSDRNADGGYLGIDLVNGNVDISFIKSASPSGKFLKDNGTWADAYPSVSGNNGKFLSNDGVGMLWTDVFPSQSGNSGKVLSTNGSTTSWANVFPTLSSGLFLTNNGTTTSWGSPFPDQSGNSGKVLSTNGSITSWSNVFPTLSSGLFLTNNGTTTSWGSPFPDQSGNSGKMLSTNGSITSWADPLPSQSSQSGKFLSTNGSSASWSSLTANTLSSSFIFSSGNGIDTSATAGNDVLNIGATNANTINYGNSNTVHNLLGTDVFITDKLITLNNGGASASGSGVGFEIQENNSITGYFKTTSDRKGFSIKTPAVGFAADILTNLITAARTFQVPDVSGTFLVGSLPSDGVITFASAGAITGSSNLTWGSSALKVNGSAFFGGSTSPTAWVHLAATSGTTPPLKFTSASLLATPQTGAIEFLTDRLYVTDTSNARKMLAYYTDIAPAGADNYIQYASGGAFTGTSRFMWQDGSNYFKVFGTSLFGLDGTSNNPTATVDIAPVISNGVASLRIRNSTGGAPSSPNDGDIWYTGGFLWIRISGVSRKFTVT